MNYYVLRIVTLAAVLHCTYGLTSREVRLTTGSKKTNCTCGWRNEKRGRIISGEEAEMHEFPMIAALVNPTVMIQFCGGTIVTNHHVLTAAHCFLKKKDKKLAVSVADHIINKNSETTFTQVIPIAKIIEHPEYIALVHNNDIALLLLEKPISFNVNVGPACLPFEKTDLVGQKVTVAGWGRTSAEGSGSDILLKVDLDVVPLDYCKKSYTYIKTNPAKQLCTFTPGKDSCTGDSGGPLLHLNPKTNRYTLVGIVSFGKSCATSHGGIWTDVYAYNDWIQQNIAESNPGSRSCS